jgi:hypothetical protein
LKIFKREKKTNIPITELDEYTTRIFHFVYKQKRIPTNQEMFLELKIPSNYLEEVIHYFNHPPKSKSLKKYTQEELRQLDAQSVLFTPFVKEEQINLTEVVINLNYNLSNARELVDFCNNVILLPEKQLRDYFELFNQADIDLNIVRVVQSHHQLEQQQSLSQETKSVSILRLARVCKLGLLSTRLAMSYYEQQRTKIPKTSEIAESRVKQLDSEIRKYFADLLKAPNVSLKQILTHENWKLPIPDPPELTIENVTKMTDDFVRKYKTKTKDPILGIFQLAGDAVNTLVNTFITPTVEKVITGSFPDPTFTHAKEVLAVLQPIRDQSTELSAAISIGLQTIQYVPAEQVEILKEKDRIFCSMCHKFFPKNTSHFQCKKCQRLVCGDCQVVGVTQCPMCRGGLVAVKP